MGEIVNAFQIIEDCGLIDGHPAYLVKCLRCGAILRKKRSKILRDKSCGCAVKRAPKALPKGVLPMHGRKVAV